MRITLNLSTIVPSRERYALAWSIPALALGLIGAVLLGVFTVRQYREYRYDKLQVAQAQKRELDLRGREAAIRRDLEKPASSETLRQVRFVNALIDSKQIALTELVGQLMKFTPKEARLSELGLEQKEEDLIVRFTIAAKSEEAVESFLNQIEEAPNFKDLAIRNQGFEEAGAQPGQISVACTVRYLPGVQ